MKEMIWIGGLKGMIANGPSYQDKASFFVAGQSAIFKRLILKEGERFFCSRVALKLAHNAHSSLMGVIETQELFSMNKIGRLLCEGTGGDVFQEENNYFYHLNSWGIDENGDDFTIIAKVRNFLP
jgi:hypothetical protein